MVDLFFNKLKAGIYKASAKDIKRMEDVKKSLRIDNDTVVISKAKEYLDNNNVNDTLIKDLFISETNKLYKTGKTTIKLDTNYDTYGKIVQHITSL